MIKIISIGNTDSATPEAMRQTLEEVLSQEAHTGDTIALPHESWNQRRKQHLASVLLAKLRSPSDPGDRVLGVVDVDIFAAGLNFVFGEADIAGRKAIISLQRLRQEFYGLPRNEKLFCERTGKEAVHELGHTYGLKHCANPACVMRFSNSLHDTDVKGLDFCPDCRARLNQ
jgi:archaemetzincin